MNNENHYPNHPDAGSDGLPAVSGNAGLYHDHLVCCDWPWYFALRHSGDGRVLYRVLAERACADGPGASGQSHRTAGYRELPAEKNR